MEGQFLITHNHWENAGVDTDDIISVEVWSATGHENISPTSLTTFTPFSTQVIGQETMVFDVGVAGYFDGLNVPSASFATASNIPIEVGDEVAVVDWDITNAYISWRTVKAITPEGGKPQGGEPQFAVHTDCCLENGASGGGVYFNGTHIANNWYYSYPSYSTSAINPPGFNVLQVASPNTSPILPRQNVEP